MFWPFRKPNIKSVPAQGNHFDEYLVLHEQLTSLRSVFFSGAEPFMLFNTEQLTRLTCLGLPAPTDRHFTRAYHLLQHLPKLAVLAIGNGPESCIRWDLPTLARLTQLQELYLSASVTVTLPQNLHSLTLEFVGASMAIEVQLPAQLTQLGIYSNTEGCPTVSAPVSQPLSRLCLLGCAPVLPVATLTAVTQLQIQHSLLMDEYTHIR